MVIVWEVVISILFYVLVKNNLNISKYKYFRFFSFVYLIVGVVFQMLEGLFFYFRKYWLEKIIALFRRFLRGGGVGD